MEIDVRHVAKLAKLEIPDDQIPQMEKELASILAMVEKLPPLQSSKSLLDPDNVMQLREDEIRASFPREELLKNAPQTAAGCLLVPRVVDE